jgi:enoyl-CoA hydratase/carnithine racemase
LVKVIGFEMPVRLERQDGVGTIVLDRPPANAYDYDFLLEFGSAIDDARVDGDVRAVVVTSASEKFFSAGADLKAFAAGSARRRAMTALLGNEVFRKMEVTPLVFVAAINGHALGGGLELALACDLRFASKGGYRLGLTETSLGLFPGTGGTQRLPRIVGLSRGIDLIARGATFGPEEAHAYGLVDRLFDDAETCLQEARAYAAAVAEGASEAIGRAKVAAQMGYGSPLDLGLAVEREAITRVFVSRDAEEGIKAFGEKRKPDFKGE